MNLVKVSARKTGTLWSQCYIKMRKRDREHFSYWFWGWKKIRSNELLKNHWVLSVMVLLLPKAKHWKLKSSFQGLARERAEEEIGRQKKCHLQVPFWATWPGELWPLSNPNQPGILWFHDSVISPKCQISELEQIFNYPTLLTHLQIRVVPSNKGTEQFPVMRLCCSHWGPFSQI